MFKIVKPVDLLIITHIQACYLICAVMKALPLNKHPYIDKETGI